MNNAIEPEMLYQIIDNQNICFIDIRDQFQFQRQHLKNFQNIPDEMFSSSFLSLPKDKIICLICYSGKRTEKLANDLCRMGYEAYYVNGGFQAFLNIHNEKYF